MRYVDWTSTEYWNAVHPGGTPQVLFFANGCQTVLSPPHFVSCLLFSLNVAQTWETHATHRLTTPIQNSRDFESSEIHASQGQFAPSVFLRVGQSLLDRAESPRRFSEFQAGRVCGGDEKRSVGHAEERIARRRMVHARRALHYYYLVVLVK